MRPSLRIDATPRRSLSVLLGQKPERVFAIDRSSAAVKPQVCKAAARGRAASEQKVGSEYDLRREHQLLERGHLNGVA